MPARIGASVGVIVALCAAAVLLAGLGVYGYYYFSQQQEARMNAHSSALLEKTSVVEQRDTQISQLESASKLQAQELQDKASQLDDLQRKIDELEQDIAKKEDVISQKTVQLGLISKELSSTKAELAALKQSESDLESRVSVLQGEVQQRDKQIVELSNSTGEPDRVTVRHYIIGVDENNKGVAFPLEVEIVKQHGSGRISVDVGDMQYDDDFQDAVRITAAAASKYANVTIADKDITVRMINNRSDNAILSMIVPSAGAEIIAGIAAGLTGKELDSKVLVTGAIHNDGMIGAIGGLASKADAAVSLGATKLLVPIGQDFQSSIEINEVPDISDVMLEMAADISDK
jgi:PDZ domain-containing secreted protein